MFQESTTQLITKVKKFKKKLQPPCSAANLAQLEKRAVAELGHSIPKAHRDFLLTMDGMNWNALVIYACQRGPLVSHPDINLEGFVDGNLLYRDFEPMNDYLVFAEDGVALYAYRISTSEYRVMLEVGITVLHSYGTFEELMDDASRACLC